MVKVCILASSNRLSRCESADGYIYDGLARRHQGVPEVSAHTARLLSLQTTERAPHKFVWRSPFFGLAVASMAPTRPRNKKRSIKSPPTTPQQSKRIRKEATTGTRSRYFQACSMRTDFWHPLMALAGHYPPAVSVCCTTSVLIMVTLYDSVQFLRLDVIP